jgi:putative PIN family toxin of toxin-antitoxin system
LRAVLDTTVWCSAFLSQNENGAARRIWNAWRGGLFIAVVSGPIVDEVARVLLEELRVPEADVEEFVVLLCGVADIVPIQHQVMGCRDRNDDAFLETALVGAANYVVTHDEDLLTLPASLAEYLRDRGVEVLADARTGERDFCGVLRDLEASPEVP